MRMISLVLFRSQEAAVFGNCEMYFLMWISPHGTRLHAQMSCPGGKWKQGRLAAKISLPVKAPF